MKGPSCHSLSVEVSDIALPMATCGCFWAVEIILNDCQHRSDKLLTSAHCSSKQPDPHIIIICCVSLSTAIAVSGHRWFQVVITSCNQSLFDLLQLVFWCDQTASNWLCSVWSGFLLPQVIEQPLTVAVHSKFGMELDLTRP